MNVINLHSNNLEKPLHKNLFIHMESSLKNAGISFEKSLRLAKTIAPLLQDRSSNNRHIHVISSDVPIEEKVIAIIMLGFPNNRPLLPFLKNLLLNGSDALAIAASLAISQMRDKDNSELLTDILILGFHSTSSQDVKASIKQSIATLSH